MCRYVLVYMGLSVEKCGFVLVWNEFLDMKISACVTKMKSYFGCGGLVM